MNEKYENGTTQGISKTKGQAYVAGIAQNLGVGLKTRDVERVRNNLRTLQETARGKDQLAGFDALKEIVSFVSTILSGLRADAAFPEWKKEKEAHLSLAVEFLRDVITDTSMPVMLRKPALSFHGPCAVQSALWAGKDDIARDIANDIIMVAEETKSKEVRDYAVKGLAGLADIHILSRQKPSPMGEVILTRVVAAVERMMKNPGHRQEFQNIFQGILDLSPTKPAPEHHAHQKEHPVRQPVFTSRFGANRKNLG